MERDVDSSAPMVLSTLSALCEDQKAAVRRELQNIVHSSAFSTTSRCQQFLTYVVERTREGHDELLKERVIGAEIFHRPPSYLTGEDPVVRVKASEVRRRLQQHYALDGVKSEVTIDLPIGGYIPKFHWHEAAASEPPRNVEKSPAPVKRRFVIIAAASLGLAAICLLALSIQQRRSKSAHSVDEFWAPLTLSSQPVLICISSTVVYRPSLSVYTGYSQSHPREFQTQSDRLTHVLPLAPDTKIRWKDMVPDSAFFVSRDDAFVAVKLSELLEKLNKGQELRSGTQVTFEDLRSSPAVLIGALNNRWTLQMTANLPFVFADEGEAGAIREQRPPGRTWRPELDDKRNWTSDYAIVARLLHSDAGRPLIVTAGIGGAGTWSAGEFLTSEEYMTAALRGAPKDWKLRNMELVLKTNMIDGLAGPPRVVASAFW